MLGNPLTPIRSSFSKLLEYVLILLSFSLVFSHANAELRESLFNMSIVTLNSYEGKTILRRGSGIVVQSDRFNGYVVTNSSYLDGGDTTTISIPNSRAELVARVMRDEPSFDFALLKVNGLNLPPL